LTQSASPSVEAQSATLINESAPRRSFLAHFQRWEWLLVALIIFVVVATSRLSPYFLDAKNISRTSSDFMELGLMMLPMVFIIITTGGVDLSVASNLGMCASFMGWLFMAGVNIWVAALAALILGSLAGFLNGTLVARLKLPPLVVTLGTYAFYLYWAGQTAGNADPILGSIVRCVGTGVWSGAA
jgi:ribose/xylose/arabinose/galactoside ABC-type transport system permease subunit